MSRAAEKRYRAKPDTPLKQRNAFLKRKYGITLEEWNTLLKSQGNKCAICFRSEPQLKQWATDHDHETGKVRSIVCNYCNSVLGFSRENPHILLEAFHYLCKHSGDTEKFILEKKHRT